MVLSSFMGRIAPGTMDIYRSLLSVTLASLPIVAVYAYRTRLMKSLLMAGLFVVSTRPSSRRPTISSNRCSNRTSRSACLSYLGIVDRPQGIDYNVNQSKIAIGSGGLFGKGLLQGTQIKYNFVPEKHTDFIFCTVGEEWGFLGAVAVLGVMCLLLLRLMKMGEQQGSLSGGSTVTAWRRSCSSTCWSTWA